MDICVLPISVKTEAYHTGCAEIIKTLNHLYALFHKLCITLIATGKNAFVQYTSKNKKIDALTLYTKKTYRNTEKRSEEHF